MVAKKVWIGDVKDSEGEVRVLGKVSDKYVAETFGSLTIFDKSGKVQVRVFKEDMKKIEEIENEDVVDVFGVVKDYKEEKYVLPSIVRKVEKEYIGLRAAELEAEDSESGKVEDENSEIVREEDFKPGIIKIIKEKDEGEGVAYETISSSVGIDNEKLQEALGELMASGDVYEPKYGRYRII